MISSTHLLIPHTYSLLWLAAALVLLLFVEHWIHRHLQGVMLLLVGDSEITAVLYALPLLPGIILHELSHAFAALLLGVQTGRISLHPRRKGKRVQLGFVPVEKTDVVRASLIGLAPLLIGNAVILLIGYLVFDLGALEAALVTGDWVNVGKELRRMLKIPNTWLWAYVIFAVSNTMLPSRSDRQAWPSVILFLLLVSLLIWAAGLGPAVIESTASLTAQLFSMALRWIAMMCTFTLLVDLPFVALILLGERLLERVKGMRVEY